MQLYSAKISKTRNEKKLFIKQYSNNSNFTVSVDKEPH